MIIEEIIIWQQLPDYADALFDAAMPATEMGEFASEPHHWLQNPLRDYASLLFSYSYWLIAPTQENEFDIRGRAYLQLFLKLRGVMGH